VLHEYNFQHPMFCYIGRQLQKRGTLQNELEGMRRSWLWKFIKPLRLIDDYLRARRRQKHHRERAVTSHV
jgi:hypothetical protein